MIFDDVEVLDFCGPFEVFSIARPGGKTDDGSGLFDVLIIAQVTRLITCRGGLLVQPQNTIDGHPPCGILIVPGGQGISWLACCKSVCRANRQTALPPGHEYLLVVR
ncbi:MAG: hypothetical protein M3Z66_22925, partial [Chloroflexota bacterium]|nr:hypothetical protein [Chloroflexota bacterium]